MGLDGTWVGPSKVCVGSRDHGGAKFRLRGCLESVQGLTEALTRF